MTKQVEHARLSYSKCVRLGPVSRNLRLLQIAIDTAVTSASLQPTTETMKDWSEERRGEEIDEWTKQSAETNRNIKKFIAELVGHGFDVPSHWEISIDLLDAWKDKSIVEMWKDVANNVGKKYQDVLLKPKVVLPIRMPEASDDANPVLDEIEQLTGIRPIVTSDWYRVLVIAGWSDEKIGQAMASMGDPDFPPETHGVLHDSYISVQGESRYPLFSPLLLDALRRAASNVGLTSQKTPPPQEPPSPMLTQPEVALLLALSERKEKLSAAKLGQEMERQVKGTGRSERTVRTIIKKLQTSGLLNENTELTQLGQKEANHRAGQSG